MRSLFVSFVASLAVLVVQTGQDSAMRADIYGVYSACLSNQWQGSVSSEVYYIRNSTVPIAGFSRATPSESCYLKTSANSGDWNEALDALKKSQFTPQPLEREFQIKNSYVLLDDKGNSDLGEKGMLKGLSGPGPNGRFFTFTPVFFNQKRTLAMVQVSMTCGPLCGEGGWKVLEKVDGQWRPYRSSCPFDWIA